MNDTLKADLQAVTDKDQQAFTVTITVPPVAPTVETVDFTPATPV